MRQQTLSRVSAGVLCAWCVLACDAATCYEKGGFNQSAWPHCFKAGANVLAYSGKQGSDLMKLGMWAEDFTSGWSALAIAGNGGMKGAREIVVRRNTQGTWIAEDRYSVSYAMPAMASSQDVKLLSAAEIDGGIAWSVLLPMDACKEDVNGLPSNYPLNEDIERTMLWALGSSHTFSHHGTSQRGTFHANLMSGYATPPSTAGLQSVTLKMPNVKVEVGAKGTDASNPYICSIFDLSKVFDGRDISKKHHVAKLEAHLNAGSAKYVHHMMLYGCDKRFAKTYYHGQTIKDCESMPRGCYELKWPWAVGSKPLFMPSDIGMPFGEGNVMVALQMHYYNPAEDKNIVDSSGVTLTLANTLRSIDAGILTLNGGTSPDMRPSLPKGKKHLELNFFVPKHCTNQWTDSHITLIGAVYHGHLLGKRFNIDVIRDGKYVGPVRRENHYDFNHQSLEAGDVQKILKGDELNFSCSYNTEGAREDVEFGDLTQNEMCFSALLYYP